MRTSDAMTDSLHRQLGLTDGEYDRIIEILGREPNRAELAMYSVMWSEHCSYKSSKIYLRGLPSEGPHVLVGPGEGAGIVKVDDVAVALRLESHNHPSFVEPFQGAATGIGGIVRDVLSVGARPIALLDSLRFGPLPSERRVDDETAERNRFLVEGVVSGISSYGNCIGVPTIGGEIKFEGSYSGNPLVNVMCIGVVSPDKIRLARAEGPGNVVLLLGSSTGRDGIGGVSVLASASFDEGAASLRPSVQVGDPFTEKLLIEACLEMMDRGLVIGIQDLGGAGISCATSESAAHAGNGMRIDLSRVHLREQGMEPFEVLTSESQERMLVVVSRANVDAALAVCDKWGLTASVIGEVTSGDSLEVFDEGSPVAEVPAASLGDGPVYDRPAIRPDWLNELRAVEVNREPDDLRAAILRVAGSPNIASKSWVYEQYDHQVMLGTVIKPGRDAAVLRIPGARSRLAVVTDGNGRYCHLDPYLGAQHTVAEAYRNLSAMGARPIAITNCLNFGNPERPEVMWQFAEAVRGMGDACTVFETPVTGGNVSFYNQTGDAAIYPTPVVGMIGVIDPEAVMPAQGFPREGLVIAVVGDTAAELGGSEYARTVLGVVGGKLPELDLGSEIAAGNLIRELISRGLLTSVHDLSEGGLTAALVEACADSGVGAVVAPPDDLPEYQWLFSESASRYLVSFEESNYEEVRSRSGDIGIHRIGVSGGSSLAIGESVDVPVGLLAQRYEESFAEAMGYPTIAPDDLP